jgi:hypothetical protein
MLFVNPMECTVRSGTPSVAAHFSALEEYDVTNTCGRIDRLNWAAIALLGLAVACAFWFTPAQAHDWYPKECCHNNDCASVESIARSSTLAASSELPRMVVTTKHGTAVIPSNLPRRESKDNRMHACMNPGPMGKMQLICIFMPPIL